MRNRILFCTILFVIAVSMCIGVPRMNSAGAEARSPERQAAPITAAPAEDRQKEGPAQQAAAQPPDAQPSSHSVFSVSGAFAGGVPDKGNIQVLNGCGIDGAAKRMAEFLRTKAFDVKDIGSAANWNYPATMIISRVADMGAANELEKILKTGKVMLMRGKDGDLYDVTVIVGPDYEGKIK
jgi:hypothetical protein